MSPSPFPTSTPSRTSATPTSWSQADVYARARRLAGDDVRFARRHRRPRPQERPRRRGGRAADGRVRRRQRRSASPLWPTRSACRSTTSCAPAPIPATGRRSSGCGGRAPPTATSTGARTRASTASAASGSTTAASWSPAADDVAVLPRAPHACRAGRRDELVLPPVPLRGPPPPADLAAASWQIHPQPFRDEVLSFIAGGLEDISVSRPAGSGPRLGHSGAGRPDAGRLRLVRRPRQLPQRPRVRRPRQRRLPTLVAAGRPARARHRQGHPALPRRVLAGVPRRRRTSRRRPASRSTRT